MSLYKLFIQTVATPIIEKKMKRKKEKKKKKKKGKQYKAELRQYYIVALPVHLSGSTSFSTKIE